MSEFVENPCFRIKNVSVAGDVDEISTRITEQSAYSSHFDSDDTSAFELD